MRQPHRFLRKTARNPRLNLICGYTDPENDGRKPIVIYDYKPSRDGDIPAEFLKDYKGYIHTDGYAGYNKVKNVTRCGCWAHLRRKFVEADTASKGEDGYARKGIAYCDKLFHIEDQLKDLSRDERYKK